MKALAAGVLALAAIGGQIPVQPTMEPLDLILPGANQRLRVQVDFDDLATGKAWAAFFEHWFDYFDRDGDGTLDSIEAARIIPLPLPDGRSAAFDFAAADTDKDGKISRAELRAFYRHNGFGPILTAKIPPSLQDSQVSEAMFRHLVGQADGTLTADHLRKAAMLLRKLDENEDEVLTLAEVLSLGANFKSTTASGDFHWVVPGKEPANNAIHLTVLGAKSDLRVATTGKAIQALPTPAGSPVTRFRFGDAVLTIASEGGDPVKAFAISRQFVLAQYANAVGSKDWLDKRAAADDPSLQVLASLFSHADRDGDGKLTVAELERFLSLLAEGATCSVVVKLTDCGRNLFAHLDTSGDKCLDAKEIRGTAWLVDLMPSAGWTMQQVPAALRLTVQRGFAGKSFGPLPLIAIQAPATSPAGPKAAKGPAWFQAMDRNGDGFVSPSEFLGPPELFRRLDLNGDGLISAEEANQAEAKSKRD